jgi:hypothetical protein
MIMHASARKALVASVPRPLGPAAPTLGDSNQSLPFAVSASSGPVFKILESAPGHMRMRVHYQLAKIAVCDNTFSGTISYPGLFIPCQDQNINQSDNTLFYNPMHTMTLSPTRGSAAVKYNNTASVDAYYYNAFAISNFMSSIAASFARFRITSNIKFAYLPQIGVFSGTTADAPVFTFAYSADSAHNALSPYSVQAGAVFALAPTLPTYATATSDIENAPNSRSFASWAEWTMEVVPPAGEYNTYCPTICNEMLDDRITSTGAGVQGSNTRLQPTFMSALRDSNFGTIACVQLSRVNSGSGVSRAVGAVYVTFEIELSDLAPLTASTGALPPQLVGDLRTSREVKEPSAPLRGPVTLDDVKGPSAMTTYGPDVSPVKYTANGTCVVDLEDDPVVVDPSPPQFKPSPSFVPGTPGYGTRSGIRKG